MKSGSALDESAFRQRLLDRAKAAGLSELPRSETCSQLALYYQLLAKWNRRINLTALPLDGFPAHTIDRLLIEPLIAAEFVPSAGARWLDLGSGGGSPAIPLKIVRPATSLTMVESRSRKAAFLREVLTTLRLERSDVLALRIEELPGRLGSDFADLITVRAVKLDDAIGSTIHTLLRSSGQLLRFASESAPSEVEARLKQRSIDVDGSLKHDRSDVEATSDRPSTPVGSPLNHRSTKIEASSERRRSMLAAKFREVKRRELPRDDQHLIVLEKL